MYPVTYMDDPQILNNDSDAYQPSFFDIAISENFNFSFGEIFYEAEAMKKAEKKVEDEDNRFFGTHIRETIETFKEVLKK